MSEQPNAPTGFLRKKVAGIPVIYLAGGFAVVLAAIAWTMKPNSAASKEIETPVESADDTILREREQYPALPLGTVGGGYAPVVSDGGNPNNDGNASIDTNETWLRKGVTYLITKHGKNPGEAQTALSLYLDSAALSYDQGAMRDLVIREYGIPPFPPTPGKTLDPVARAQGPLPRGHVVKGANDDSVSELAMLYYGTKTEKAKRLISHANAGQDNYAVGQIVQIPKEV